MAFFMTIVDRTLIGYGVKKFSSNHHVPPNHGVVGCNVIVLPGRTIADGAVVGSGSVVTKDVPVFTTIAGNPA